MSEIFPAFSQDIFVGIVGIAFHLSIGTIWGQKIRMQWYDFLLLSGIWAEKFRLFVKNFKQGSSKQQSTRPGGRNVYLLKKNLYRFRTFSQNSSAICPKVCGDVVKTEFSINRGSCQRKNYCSEEITLSLSNSNFEWKTLSLDARNFCRICQKTAFS